MHFEVRPGVVLFCASIELTTEFVNILMCPHVITKYPISFKFLLAPWKCTGETCRLLRAVSILVVDQVLLYLKTLVATREAASIFSGLKMGNLVLSNS